MSILNQGLLITAVGMGLVFLMILALWGIMVLLVKLTNKPEAKEEEPPVETVLSEPEAAPASDLNAAIAAAIAVAYALKNQEFLSGLSPRPSGNVENAWWTAGRTQQLYSNTIRGRKR